VYSIRTTSTKSGATAIQVVRYVNRKTVVVKHIGSSKRNDEIKLLKIAAQQWRKNNNPQLSLLATTQPPSSPGTRVIVVNKSELVAVHLVLSYQVLMDLSHRLGFLTLVEVNPNRQLLLDLVVARILHPASKLASLQFLSKELGLTVCGKTKMYRLLLEWSNLQNEIEQLVVSFAQKHLGLTFQFIFYDVTTLYYESFIPDDELRQMGFSKDHKFGQPQVVLGLVVNNQGFPISYQLFPGNTFEGHTFIPVIESLQKKYGIATMTVVADAAMISQDNVDDLIKARLHYIVGARLGNLASTILGTINRQLPKVDGATTCLSTKQGKLVCSWSKKRYAKDRYETEKQIEKAQTAISKPSKSVKKLKFVSTKTSKLRLNQKLINKTKMLWGIKGYYTNLTSVNNQDIIDQYRQLWQVEKSFRIAKSDLKSRPIFHYKTESIKTHILICFMALAIAKYIEITTNVSINQAIKILKTVKDAKIEDKLTGEVVTFRSAYSGDVENLLGKLGLSY